MAYEQKEGDIAIFKVKEKKSDKGPDWTGTAVINGQKMRVAVWEKSSTMLAGQIKIDDYKPDFDKAKEAVKSSDNFSDGLEDSIPF